MHIDLAAPTCTQARKPFPFLPATIHTPQCTQFTQQRPCLLQMLLLRGPVGGLMPPLPLPTLLLRGQLMPHQLGQLRRLLHGQTMPHPGQAPRLLARDTAPLGSLSTARVPGQMVPAKGQTVPAKGQTAGSIAGQTVLPPPPPAPPRWMTGGMIQLEPKVCGLHSSVGQLLTT